MAIIKYYTLSARRLCTPESDVYGCHILTYEVDPGTESDLDNVGSMFG